MTLATHANAALRDGTALRLPAHPAFMVVRRARLVDGDETWGVDAWFARAQQQSGTVLLADAGVDADAVLVAGAAGWSVGGVDGAVVLAPHHGVHVTAGSVGEAAELLRAAAGAARDMAGRDAPPSWFEAVERAVAILDSAGTGEELSDVAWPHFLLPASAELSARRLAAAGATLWLWGGTGSWTGDTAESAHAHLRGPVAAALTAAVNCAA